MKEFLKMPRGALQLGMCGGLLWLKLSKNAVEMVECQIHPSKSSKFKRKSNFEFHDIILK